MKTIEQLKKMIMEELGIEPECVLPNARFCWHPDHANEPDLGMDSLDTVELVMAVEDDWKISISDEEASPIETVEQLAALIDRKLTPA
jgi:acyl carrier protein